MSASMSTRSRRAAGGPTAVALCVALTAVTLPLLSTAVVASAAASPTRRPAVAVPPSQAAVQPARSLAPGACPGSGTPPSLAAVTKAVSKALKNAATVGKVLGAGAEAAGQGSAAAGLRSAAGSLGTLSQAVSYAFAYAAFQQANAAFDFAGTDPLDPDDTAIFRPQFVRLPAVQAPAPGLAAAFDALNAYFDTVTRFSETAVALRVSLDRMEAAGVTGNEPWLARQAGAVAGEERALAGLLTSFPELQARLVRSFVADKLTLSLSAAQVVRAQAALAGAKPPELTHLLDLAASSLRPNGNGEVRTLARLISDVAPLQREAVRAKAAALELPAAFDPNALVSAENGLAVALRSSAVALLAVTAPARAGATPASAGSPVRGQLAAIPQCGAGSASATSYGEPHEVTFSGSVDYEFQAAGEFTLARSSFDNLDVQVREQPYPGSGEVAVNTAVAMQDGFADVELAADARGNLQLWIDRRPARLKSRALLGGGSLSVSDPNHATLRWPDGSKATVYSTGTIAVAGGRVTCNSWHTIYVTMTVPRLQFGHLAGLLGQAGPSAASSVTGGAVTGGNGVVYPILELAEPTASARDFDVLYHQFGQSWRVRQSSSLFAYPKGESTANFTERAFPSEALTIQSFTPRRATAAERDCRAVGITNRDLLADCVFDVGATGSSCFAGGDAVVQTSGLAPPASALPPSSGVVPPLSSSGTGPGTSPASTTSSTLPPGKASGTGTGTGGPVIDVGNAGSASQPALAVDSAGTAYLVWSLGDETTLDFCTLPRGSSSCHPLSLHIADPHSDRFFDPPSVLLDHGEIEVFEDVDTVGDDELNGLDEYVSSDGGSSFSLLPHAVGSVSTDSGTTGHVVALPGGDLGAVYVVPEANPEFQANSLASPSDDSSATSPAYATLNPSPSSAYTVANLGGALAAQLTGSPGVLAVFEAPPGKGSSPCPSSAPQALVYAYAPVSASTPLSALNSSPGVAGSAWRPLSKLDCEGTDPAVGGGPAGLGLLETVAGSGGSEVVYRRFSPATGFGAAVPVAAAGPGLDATLSQDGAGHLSATWIEDGTGVELSSSVDGASWSGPRTLTSDTGHPSAISALTSAVNPAGIGWIAYTAGGKEYAQQFAAAPASSP